MPCQRGRVTPHSAFRLQRTPYMEGGTAASSSAAVHMCKRDTSSTSRSAVAATTGTLAGHATGAAVGDASFHSSACVMNRATARARMGTSTNSLTLASSRRMSDGTQQAANALGVILLALACAATRCRCVMSRMHVHWFAAGSACTALRRAARTSASLSACPAASHASYAA